MNSSRNSFCDKQPKWVWVIMTNNDLQKWLALMEERQDYEKCAAIWNELNKRLNSRFDSTATAENEAPQ